ncbi:MAG TPA: response regulator [Candidatus Limnocylindrales bacterium]|nr:response regulator [Candidatus Limnocylindrales bacterium]
MPDPQTDAPPPDRDALDMADAAHELGNRLAAIVAFSHLLRTDPRLPDDLRDQAALLVQEADRTRWLVDRILVSAAARTLAPATTPAASAPPITAGARILVVEDEPAIREYLGRLLRGLGYAPLLVGDAAAALAIVDSDPPDAIVCDHRLPGLTGAAFNDSVAERRPDLARRFALMSGDISNPDLRAAADERGIGLLAKPFDVDTVARTVEEILAA